MPKQQNRGAALRAHKRNHDNANKAIADYADASSEKANVIVNDTSKLKISFLGGQDGIGEKNMQIIEYGDTAIVLDCGIDLSVDLPGVNYAIADPAYLSSISSKLKAYVISHGHLDHIGGLKHIVPRVPAPIYGSPFTIGIVKKTFEEVSYKPQTITMNMDSHERLQVGVFTIELVRVTHSVPESSCIVVDTPVGRIVNTGDFRLDPEPLDNMPTDIARLKQLGDEGVLALLSESTYTDIPGRQITEHTLQGSFHDLIGHAEGRLLVSIFSSNMNRVQMIINAAVAAGRKVALDGRSMMAYAEIAVTQGSLRVPKGTIVPLSTMASLPDNQILIICTGGQGEPGSALQRMADGEHRVIKLRAGDTVVISSNPIPGNEIRYQTIGNQLAGLGVHLFRNRSHEIDGCGPLHVGGHARRDEHREMIEMLRPTFFVPIYAGALNRAYHGDIAIEAGLTRKHIMLAKNGDSLLLTSASARLGEPVPHGSLLVNDNGSIISGLVVKDRILLGGDGIVTIIVTIDKKSGQLRTSPDIISRGFVSMRGSEDLMKELRSELKRAVQQRFKRIDYDRFKLELRDFVSQLLFEKTGQTPMVIPVINVLGGQTKTTSIPKTDKQTDQQRFQEMRAKLVVKDQ